MNVFGHDDECVQLKASFAAIFVNGLKEEFDVILDDEESSSLSCFESYEIGSGW